MAYQKVLSPITSVAIEAAKKAGEILCKGFGTHYQISLKPGNMNFVTEYDIAAEKAIIEHIHQYYPTHGILAEESGASDMTGDYLWIIDPLDGTTNFAHHIPVFSISIGVMGPNGMHAGVIYQPITQELFVAENGAGAYMNELPVQVSKTVDLTKALTATTFPPDVHDNPKGCIYHFNDILKEGTTIRNFGSAALHLAYVASGRMDAYWSVFLYPWDVAAGILLIKEAGGQVTTYENNLFLPLSNDSLVASNAAIHSQILSKLNQK